jgi:hypothetical protein
MFDENGLGDQGTDTAWAPESGKRNNDMDKKDDEVAHRGIAAGIANSRSCGPGSRK